MIYLVTRNKLLFENSLYKVITDLTIVFNYVYNLNEISIDTENSGLDPHTSYEYCFQIGDDKNQFIIDCLTFSYKEFKSLLEYTDKLYIIQNAKYDLQFFYKYNIIIKGKIWDTYLAELRLTNGIKGPKKNLQALEEKYLNTNLVDKSKRKDIHVIPKLGYTDQIVKYAAGDIMVLHLIKEKQYKEAIKLDLLNIINLECEFVKVLAYSEYCGIYMDKDKWYNIAKINDTLLKEYLLELNTWVLNNAKKYPQLYHYIQPSLFDELGATININWNSSKQVIKILEYLGYNCTIIEKGKSKKTSEAKHLSKQIDICDILPLYLNYSSKYKEVSTYGFNFLTYINPKTNRIHPSYFQGLISGRLSSGGDEQSEDADTPNIMVIPRTGGYRQCFIAQNSEENILINYDYSAMENTVFANKCKDPIHMEQIIKGIDQHSYVAKIAFKEELKDIPQDEVKYKAKNLRQDAKSVGFAILFGGTDYTLSGGAITNVFFSDRKIPQGFPAEKEKWTFYIYLKYTTITTFSLAFCKFVKFNICTMPYRTNIISFTLGSLIYHLPKFHLVLRRIPCKH
jgi:DNA polymerase-1